MKRLLLLAATISFAGCDYEGAYQRLVDKHNGINPAVPGAPTSVSAVAGDGAATVSWVAPEQTGTGGPITGYTVTSVPGGFTATTTGETTTTVTGLINGTAYTFTVRAANAAGDGPESLPSTAVTPATVPGAPTITSVVRGNQEVTVNWLAPVSNGGSPIIGYRIIATPGAITVNVGDVSTAVVTGLTNGTAYTFTVQARNEVGLGTPSAASNPVTPATVPDAPTAVVATAGNASATVSWTAPTNSGGSVITGYTVTSNPDNLTATTTGATTVTVTGLTNGTAYTFTVVATNARGDSVASSASSSVTPSTVPGAPLNVTGTRGNQQIIVSWDPPVFNGGAPITAYKVTSNPGNFTATSSTTSATVTGLANGTPYTFTVVATNQNGDGIPSAPSASITPATVPNPPTNVTGVSGNQQVTVSWNAPANNGGSPITGYTVTSNPGSISASSSTTTATVTGLTNGTAYTFRVVATNAVGNSGLSSPSAAVTPATVPDAPTNVVATAEDEAASITFTPPANNGGASVTSYIVTANPGGMTKTFSATDVIFDGLTNHIAYTFTVAAKNVVGTGAGSAPSNQVTPVVMPDVLSATVTGVGGCMTVEYMLYQKRYVRADVKVEVDPGTGTFVRATQAGTDHYEYTGTRGVFTSAVVGGELRKFLWDSRADIPSLRATNVRIRVSASYNGVTGITHTTAPFTVDNGVVLAGAGVKVDAGSAASDLVVADLNRDGRADVIAAESQTEAFSVLLGAGDGGFGVATYYSTGAARPSGLAEGDFDRDGKMDLLAALGSARAFGLYRGNGDGTFQSPTTFDAGFSNKLPVAADFNRDGKLDFVATSSGTGGGGYQLFLGQGNGTFVPGSIQQAVNTVDLLVEDFNNDGKPDVAGVNSGTARVELLIGDGFGVLNAPVSFVAGNGVKSIAAGDFNRDGRVDIATANSTGGTASILLANGPGSLAAPVSFSVGAGLNHVHASDLDRDGQLDLLFSLYGPSRWIVYKGVGDGTFNNPVTIPLNETNSNPNFAVTANLDADGPPEIVSADFFPFLRVLDNLSAISCGAPLAGPIAAETLRSASGVAVGEINGDGRLDIVVASRYPVINASWLHIIHGRGDGQFVHTSQGIQVSAPEAIALGDFNGDAITDAVSTSSEFGVVTVARGVYNSQQFNSPADFAAGTQPRGVVAVDLDRDGKLDVVATDSMAPPAQALSFLRGQGNLSLAARKTYAAGAGASGVTTGDFNLDGWPDIATANADAGSVSIALGAGDGGLLAPASRSAGTRPVAIAAADLDSDSFPDLIVADSAANAVYSFKGAATGFSASPSGTYPVGATPVAVAVSDFTGDGRLDIATADSAADTATLLIGQSGGGFQPAKSYRVGPQPSALAVGDVNDDGRPDLVVSNKGSGIVTTLLSAGSSGFAADLASIAVSSFPQVAVTGDFNSDGAADIAVAADVATGSDLVCVSRASATGTLDPPMNHFVEQGPSGIAQADLNRDGSPDLVVANKFSSSVSVLLGSSSGSFASAQHSALPSNANAGGVAIADFDLDGWPDVAVANSGLGDVSLLRGSGGASLTPAATTYAVNGSPTHLAAADFNRDGAPDLLVGEQAGSTGSLGLLINDRAGGFLARQGITIPYGTIFGLRAADFTGDGRVDIAAMLNGNGGVLAIIPATATGFDAPVEHLFFYSTGVQGLDVADFNRDGWPDVSVGVDNGLVAVMLNRGDGEFERHRLMVRPGIRSLASGDINRDGKLDLFTVGQASSRVDVVPGR